MAERRVKVDVSATEIPEFRRLVDFLTEASVHADAMEDDELRDLVRACRIDLMRLHVDPEAPDG